MNTASKLGPPTQKKTEGLAQVGCSEFTTKAAAIQGGSEDLVLNRFVVVFVPVFARAYGSREVARAEELAERRIRATAPITPGSRSKSTAQGAYLPFKASS